MYPIHDIVEPESNRRKQVIIKLNEFLTDPGRFSILVLGMRGTGKSHWVKKLQELNKKDKYLSDMIVINALIAKEKGEDYWESIIKKADNKLLLIDDIEHLGRLSQEILFDILSTGKGALYGLGEKKYRCRLVFTSTKDISDLRENRDYLSNKFFDRISQFVIKFPSYSDEDTKKGIWNDFKSTWNKMQFPEKEIPSIRLKEWLLSNAHKLHGNFRDLDKIAINWRNYQINKLPELQILEKVIEGFWEFYHFPEHRSELNDYFHLDPSMDYEQLMKDFRHKLKEWAPSTHGGKMNAANKLKISPRTMERW